MTYLSIFNILIPLIVAPLIPSIINRTKALFAGRNGPPLLQPYYDIIKLFKKDTVYSKTTTWIFKVTPAISFGIILSILTLLSVGGIPSILSFEGDVILFVYLFAFMRFFTVLSALDTGSSFSGMGASREVTFSALTEVALLLGLASIAKQTHITSISTMFPVISTAFLHHYSPTVLLVALSFLLVLLTENCRIPIDDPNTHLELTMIHEVMILDYSGPNLGFIFYTSALKLWAFSLLLVNMAMPLHAGHFFWDSIIEIALIFILAIVIGIIESSMARLRLLSVPELLFGAIGLSILALILV